MNAEPAVDQVAQPNKVFRSDRPRFWRYTALGVVMSAMPAYLLFVKGDASVLILVGLVGFSAMTAYFLANAVMGRPYLELSSDRLTLISVFRKSWIEWGSLGAGIALGINSAPSLSYKIVGPNVSRNLRRAKFFVISGFYVEPYENIQSEIAAFQGRAVAQQNTCIESVEDVEVGPEIRAWLTYALLASLSFAFMAEQIFALGTTSGLRLSAASLVALGGMNGGLVTQNGDWYRFFTAPLLHLDATHLLMNGIALFIIGPTLERLVGRLWLGALFIISAATGVVASFIFNATDLTSVGASGAIMGLFSAALILSYHFPKHSEWYTSLQISAGQVLVPSLIPLATVSGKHVDYAAHAGGAIGGALLAFFLVKVWSKTEMRPGFIAVAKGVVFVGSLMIILSAATAAKHYPEYANTMSSAANPQ